MNFYTWKETMPTENWVNDDVFWGRFGLLDTLVYPKHKRERTSSKHIGGHFRFTTLEIEGRASGLVYK
jgi:hypothetical protein